jgi:hypothetical protein
MVLGAVQWKSVPTLCTYKANAALALDQQCTAFPIIYRSKSHELFENLDPALAPRMDSHDGTVLLQCAHVRCMYAHAEH